MVGVKPFALARSQKRGVDKIMAHGDHGDVLEAQVGFVAEAVGRGGFAGHDYVCGWLAQC